MISGLSVSVFNLKLLNSRSRASLAKLNYLYLHKRGILFLFFSRIKKVYVVVPPKVKVEYRLTEVGKSLLPLIQQVTDWAQANMKKVMTHRKNLNSQKQNRNRYDNIKR